MKQIQFLMFSLFITTAGLNAMETEKPISSPISIPKKSINTIAKTHPTPVNQSPDDVKLNAAVVAMALTQISREEDPSSQGDTSSHEGQGYMRNDDRDYFEEEHELEAGSYEGSPAGEYYSLKASNAKQRKINNRKK